MAITIVQQSVATSGTSTPFAGTYGLTPTAGNLIIMQGILSATGTVDWSASAPAGWTVAVNQAEAFAAWKVADGTENGNTFTPGGIDPDRWQAWSLELAGARTATNPFDTSGYGAYAAVATVTLLGSSNMSVNNEIGLAMTGGNTTDGGDVSATNSYNLVGSGTTRDVRATRIYSGTGAGIAATTDLTWTTANNGRKLITTWLPPVATLPPAVVNMAWT